MVRPPALHQQGRGFESWRLDLSLGCWTYDQCNPRVWGAEVSTRILRPGEDMWKITRMSSEHDPPVPARKPPLLITQHSYDRMNYLAGSGSGGGGGVRDAVAEPAQQLGADGAVPRVRGQGQRAALRHLHLRGVSTCNMSRI